MPRTDERTGDIPAGDEIWGRLDRYARDLLAESEAALVWRIIGLVVGYVVLVLGGVLLAI